MRLIYIYIYIHLFAFYDWLYAYKIHKATGVVVSVRVPSISQIGQLNNLQRIIIIGYLEPYSCVQIIGILQYMKPFVCKQMNDIK